ncbi:MAG: CRISPR-associated endonuclease Cas2 [Thermoanaerobaculia bacterium]|nr:MAG: CRISPR-associated endonuclease Cas2 [Thermoanaerobaculia bacterium]MBZ0100804.1 CRISPR-associated endonuclease Cas2 [Thermoanaerobaculia bacterium]
MSRARKSTRRRRPRRESALSGYRLMWLLVMFDLPVETREERKQANRFRHDLLGLGFERCQFSVYLRFCEGREQVETATRRVEKVLPKGGLVYCLAFTDRQYESIIRFDHRKRLPGLKSPDQFLLF